MKKAIQISLILITFSLLSVSYLLTLASAEGQFADPDCAPGAAHPELCDDHTDGGPGHNPGGGFVDPDCPPGSPPGTVCDDHADGGPGHNPGGGFVDPDCPPGTPAGTTCMP